MRLGSLMPFLSFLRTYLLVLKEGRAQPVAGVPDARIKLGLAVADEQKSHLAGFWAAWD